MICSGVAPGMSLDGFQQVRRGGKDGGSTSKENPNRPLRVVRRQSACRIGEYASLASKDRFDGHSFVIEHNPAADIRMPLQPSFDLQPSPVKAGNVGIAACVRSAIPGERHRETMRDPLGVQLVDVLRQSPR